MVILHFASANGVASPAKAVVLNKASDPEISWFSNIFPMFSDYCHYFTYSPYRKAGSQLRCIPSHPIMYNLTPLVFQRRYMMRMRYGFCNKLREIIVRTSFGRREDASIYILIDIQMIYIHTLENLMFNR